jgi:hypothetical protein
MPAAPPPTPRVGFERVAVRFAWVGSPAVEERSPETRRRLRLFSPPLAFIGGLLLLAALVAAIIIVIWALGGFGEGSEGA